jgi:hypothetical protein
MSDSYNYNFLKILTERSIDIIDTKSLLTYGMIGITTVVLAVATLYDEGEDEQNEVNILDNPSSTEMNNEASPEYEVDNKSVFGGKSETSGGKSETSGGKSETSGGKRNKKSRKTKRKSSKK